VAYASSLDQIGPFARDVRGCAEILSVIAGHDRMDATSLEWPVDAYADRLSNDIKGLRIGLPEEYFGAGLDSDVETVVKSAIEQLEKAGALVVPVSLPHTKYALAAYYIIAPAEASANLSRFDGVKYGLSVDGTDIWESFSATRGKGFGAEVKRRIMIGTYALSAGYYDAYYLRAQRARTLIKRDFDDALERVDVIAGPTAPTVAFKIGEKVDDPMSMYLTDVFTVPVNIAGLPALVVPCGIAQSMPVGLQFIGPAGAESRLLNLGSAFEQITSSAPWRPELAIPEIIAG
jgi:aspartyl-tRNA(Asn)/glutamyl-tRNA(Gln) amidotransferase subunit A